MNAALLAILTGASGWLNTTGLTREHLQGKTVVMAFWTSGLAECAAGLTDIQKLEARFGDRVAIIGVHSPRFDAERDIDHVRSAVIREQISFPVFNDADSKLREAYGIDACPAAVVLNSEGQVAGRFVGADTLEEMSSLIEPLARRHGPPAPLSLERDRNPSRASLSFPSQILVDLAGRRLFVSDTGNHRIVVADLTGKVREVIGSGVPGHYNAALAQAQFNRPHGLALNGNTLFVADTGNNCLRRVDLDRKIVSTAVERDLALPTGLLLSDGILYIASSGSQQIRAFKPATGESFHLLGSGAKGLREGLPPIAELAQPTSLAIESGVLYIADAQASAIRAVDLGAPSVTTIIGNGLFTSGDNDGVGRQARLQHPEGVAASGRWIFIADTYNGKIKRLDPATLEVKTIASGFRRPTSVAAYDPGLLVVDSAAHELVKISLDGGRLGTLALKGLNALAGPPVPPELPRRDQIALGPVPIKAQAEAAIALTLQLPEGYHLNPRAPFRFRIAESFGAIEFQSQTRRGILVGPRFPIEVKFKAPAGESRVFLDVDFFYCRNDNTGLCRAASKRYDIVFAGQREAAARRVPIVLKP